jgi:uncharacterized membrane protein YfcA
MDYNLIFLAVLPVVAFLYAAVGHGGASGYLALMALFSFAPEEMKPTALLLNLFVAGISFFHYWRSGFFKLKLFLVFAIASVPLSFLGGNFSIDVELYKMILGVLLIFAVLKMLNVFGNEKKDVKSARWLEGILAGGVIGFFSGLIGIGGGIILSPVILLLRWGTMKQAAAVSALFIWVNSGAGLAGQFNQDVSISTDAWIYVSIAVTGGFIGGLFGSRVLNDQKLRYMLAFVLVIASVKLIFT